MSAATETAGKAAAASDTAARNGVRNYALVTLAYWADTLADGAIRTLVLFYFYQLGYSALQVASLFLFYEIFGIVTNFGGGYLGSRFGLKTTLFLGLGTQLVALSLLALLPARAKAGFIAGSPCSRVARTRLKAWASSPAACCSP